MRNTDPRERKTHPASTAGRCLPLLFHILFLCPGSSWIHVIRSLESDKGYYLDNVLTFGSTGIYSSKKIAVTATSVILRITNKVRGFCFCRVV